MSLFQFWDICLFILNKMCDVRSYSQPYNHGCHYILGLQVLGVGLFKCEISIQTVSPLQTILLSVPFIYFPAESLSPMNPASTTSNLTVITINFWEDGASLLICTLKSHTVSAPFFFYWLSKVELISQQWMFHHQTLVIEVVQADTNLHVSPFYNDPLTYMLINVQCSFW